MKIRCIHTKIAMLTILIVAVLTLAACGRSGVDWLWNDGDSPSLDNEDMIIRVTGEATDTQTTPEADSENTEIGTEAGSTTETENATATETEVVTESATIAVSGSEAETTADTTAETTSETVTETEAETTAKTDTELETDTDADTLWANAVPYEANKTHEGTDIRYLGTGENRDKIIVIDAGHQAKGNSETEPLGPGSDEMKPKVSSGTSGEFSHMEEYELNLRVALALRDELIKRGYSVVMIRETHNVDISNAERAQIANECHADAFIRIHANSWETADKKGAMVVCQTKENPFPDCRAVYTESRKLSECLLDAYCESSGIGRYGSDGASIWETDTMSGINWSAVPTTILEMGFMSNQADDLRMAEEDFAQDAATGIANGLNNYFAAIAA